MSNHRIKTSSEYKNSSLMNHKIHTKYGSNEDIFVGPGMTNLNSSRENLAAYKQSKQENSSARSGSNKSKNNNTSLTNTSNITISSSAQQKLLEDVDNLLQKQAKQPNNTSPTRSLGRSLSMRSTSNASTTDNSLNGTPRGSFRKKGSSIKFNSSRKEREATAMNIAVANNAGYEDYWNEFLGLVLTYIEI